MQELNKRINLSDAIILFVVASLTFMFIPAWIPFLRIGWQLLVLATIIILLNGGVFIPRKALIALLLYWIVLVINAEFGDEYIQSVPSAIYELLVLYVSSSLLFYSIGDGKRTQKKIVRSLLYITFVGLLIESVASFFILETNPGMIRGLYLASLEENDPEFMYGFYKMGMMDYSMGHAIPILVPPLFCYLREGVRKVRWISILLLIICAFLVWLSDSSTALLLVVMMFVLGIFVKGNALSRNNKVIIFFVLLVSVIILFSDSLMSRIFDIAFRLVGQDTLYSDRLEELQLSSMEGQTTGDLKSRIDLYSESIDMFFSNIVFGSNQMPGRHSGILDRLATTGLVGFIPLMFFFLYSLRSVWKLIPQNRRIYYLECIIAAFLMLFFKSMWVWPVFLYLFVISPCILVLNQDKH